MSSLLRPARAAGGAVVAGTPVTVTTLDEYCAANGIERIDLLENDTQGYELEVLRGAESLMAAGRIRLVYLELIFSEMYEGLPPFDLVYRFLAGTSASSLSTTTTTGAAARGSGLVRRPLHVSAAGPRRGSVG
jgi:Methyltransferase FkbM domain